MKKNLFFWWILILTGMTIPLIFFAEYKRIEINSLATECGDLQNDIQRNRADIQFLQLSVGLDLANANVSRVEALTSNHDLDKIRSIDEFIESKKIEQNINSSRIEESNIQVKRMEKVCASKEVDSVKANFVISILYIFLSVMFFISGLLLSTPVLGILSSESRSRK